MTFKLGDRVQLRPDKEHAVWFRNRALEGRIIGVEDGNVVVRFDQDIQIGGSTFSDFSLQEESLQLAAQPNNSL